ncbi:MAG: bis(5'-nucleosyl)-tetraphosphatase (symmetrical) YqeK [Bacillota bacterium]|jgi:predicted HD superfamily hydrolase involved in NAD metabolism
MERKQILEILSSRVSERRLRHCLGVETIALQLADRFGAPPELVPAAALFHDLCREYTVDSLLQLADKFDIVIDDIERLEPMLLHGAVAAALLQREWGWDEPEVLEAITYHITGAAGIAPLARLIFVADLIEPNRTIAAARELRRRACEITPDQLVLLTYNRIINYLVTAGYTIHPRTIAGRNELIKKGVKVET